MPTTIRPMRRGDVPAIPGLQARAFDDLDRRFGEEPWPPGDPAHAAVRLEHLLATDPGGAWVAEREGAIAGCALALVREGLWGLSLLVVDPAAQSQGLGRELLARAHDYGSAAGARGRLILASRDARALRAYANLGLDLHPAAMAIGVPRGAGAPPADVRPAEPGDRAWMDALARALRGAAHGDDIDAFARAATAVSVLPGAGYTVARGGSLKLLAARDEDAARALLRAHFAASGGREVTVEWLTSAQQWAIRECLEAGLRLDSAGGAVLAGGKLGPLCPYLPSGAYL